jgi:hypothetical protein
VRRADRRAQVVRVEHAVGEGERSGAQAVDLADDLVEGQRRELGLAGPEDEDERRPGLPRVQGQVLRARGSRQARGLLQGADARPRRARRRSSIGRRVGAEGGRDRQRRGEVAAGRAEGDDDGLVVARALLGELALPAASSAGQEVAQPGGARCWRPAGPRSARSHHVPTPFRQVGLRRFDPKSCWNPSPHSPSRRSASATAAWRSTPWWSTTSSPPNWRPSATIRRGS